MLQKTRTRRMAKKIIGMKDEHAFSQLMRAQVPVRYIVMDGKRCYRNHMVTNQTVCIFTDAKGIVSHAVVGSKGIYDHPAYKAAEVMVTL
jgi:hypothetical protein